MLKNELLPKYPMILSSTTSCWVDEDETLDASLLVIVHVYTEDYPQWEALIDQHASLYSNTHDQKTQAPRGAGAAYHHRAGLLLLDV